MVDGLTLEFIRNHPADATALLNRQSVDDVAALLEALPAAEAANLLKRLLPQKGSRCLALMQGSTAARAISMLPADYAAMLLRRLDMSRRHLLINALPTGLAAALRITLRFPDAVVGSIMDANVPVVQEDMSVADALDVLRSDREHVSNTLIVVDGNNHLSGLARVRQLLAADPSLRMVDLKAPARFQFPARLGLAGLLEHGAWHVLDAVPVVDHRDMVLGALRREALALALTGGRADHPANSGVGELVFDFADVFWSACAGLFAPDKGERTEEER